MVHPSSAPPPSYSEVCPETRGPLLTTKLRTVLLWCLVSTSILLVVGGLLLLGLEVASLRASLASLAPREEGVVGARLGGLERGLHNTSRHLGALEAKLRGLARKLEGLEQEASTWGLMTSGAGLLPPFPAFLLVSCLLLLLSL